jgi:hypothetical protein
MKMTNDLRKAVEMALEALEITWATEGSFFDNRDKILSATQALRQALAHQDHIRDATKKVEPVAWFIQYSDSHEFVWSKPDGWWVKQALEIQPLYTAPPKREWIELTNEDIHNTEGYEEDRKMFRFAKSLLAKLKEKNNG